MTDQPPEPPDFAAALRLPPRTPWQAGFPDVEIHTTVLLRDGHPDYAAAKAGDPMAALSLATDLLSGPTAERIGLELRDEMFVLLPITALETTGFNAIPDAMAQVLAVL